jgi:hypothetical protein
MQRDAKISTRLYQLSVPGPDRRIPGLWPLRQPYFNGNAKALARLAERLVDTWAASVNDDDASAVSRDQALQHDDREFVACPCSFASKYDTHVQIIEASKRTCKTPVGPALRPLSLAFGERPLRCHRSALQAFRCPRMMQVSAVSQLADDYSLPCVENH